MRLKTVEREHGFLQRLVLLYLKLRYRCVPDIVRAVFHRPELFGNAFNAWIDAALRGPSEWSVGERELMAAFTSSVNRCRF